MDGCQPGQSRTTGVERITHRLAEPTKLFLFVASTGSKFAPVLMKMNEEKVNDGVFGRVRSPSSGHLRISQCFSSNQIIYLHQPTINELPQPTLIRQGSVPNHTHFAHVAHILLRDYGPFEFRFELSAADITDISPRKIKLLFDWLTTETCLASMSPEMINARIAQGVNQPDYVRVGFNRRDFDVSSDPSIESSYRKCKDLCQELWLP